jgi:hypothetical protein
MYNEFKFYSTTGLSRVWSNFTSGSIPPNGVKNGQVRVGKQPFQPFQYFKPNTVSSAPATGASPPLSGGKRRRRKTTKKSRTKRMRKTRRH